MLCTMYHGGSQDGGVPYTESRDYFSSFLFWKKSHIDQAGLKLAL